MNASHPERRSPRLKGYDYAQPGAYFVTLCTAQREQLFGDVVGSEMRLSKIGQVASHHWLSISEHFPIVSLDAFVVMPNHVHGIIMITASFMTDTIPVAVGTRYISSPQSQTPIAIDPASPSTPQNAVPRGVRRGSLGAVIGTYKAAVTRDVHAGTRYISSQTTPHIWQQRYHDHIIRSEQALSAIREYIHHNPALWEKDVFYAQSKTPEV